MCEYKDIESFREELEARRARFETFLLEKLKPRTVYRHTVVISNLIDFICFRFGVSCFEDIRRGMVCSRFRIWYCNNMADLTETQVNTAVKKFFSFLANEQGLPIGKDVLKGLKIKPLS